MRNDYLSLTSRLRVPSGYLLGLAYVVFAQPIPTLLAVGTPIALLGLLLRGWGCGYLEKNLRLAEGGPYAYSRNPLYLGSFLLGIGFAVAGGTLILGVLVAASMTFIYWPVMRQEEAHLAAQFGPAYTRYAANVPLFWPGRGSSRDSGQRFSWSRYRNNREYQAALGFVATLGFLLLKLWLR